MRRTQLQIAAAIVLVIGLAAGAAIYALAEDEPSATSYVIVGDSSYAVDSTRTMSSTAG